MRADQVAPFFPPHRVVRSYADYIIVHFTAPGISLFPSPPPLLLTIRRAFLLARNLRGFRFRIELIPAIRQLAPVNNRCDYRNRGPRHSFVYTAAWHVMAGNRFADGRRTDTFIKIAIIRWDRTVEQKSGQSLVKSRLVRDRRRSLLAGAETDFNSGVAVLRRFRRSHNFIPSVLLWSTRGDGLRL